jgi:hypothetical protein
MGENSVLRSTPMDPDSKPPARNRSTPFRKTTQAKVTGDFDDGIFLTHRIEKIIRNDDLQISSRHDLGVHVEYLGIESENGYSCLIDSARLSNLSLPVDYAVY